MQRVVTGAIAVAMLASGTAAVAGQTGSRTAVAVIVQGPNSATDVRAVGGKTTLALDLIGGVAATVPEFAIARLQSEGLAVSPDVAARVADAGFANPGGDAQNPPAAQPAPVASDAGHGIAVALIDTGVADTQDLTVASGRLVLLYDPAGQTGWAGPLRVIAYIHADLDPDIAEDPLIGQVGWTWLTEALGQHTGGYAEPSGTVTTVVTEGFGAKESEPAPGPQVLDGHLAAWCAALCTAAGLPPLAEGVSPLPPGSRRPR